MVLEFEHEEVEATVYEKGENPLELFVKGDVEMRSKIILNHPDVIGFLHSPVFSSFSSFHPLKTQLLHHCLHLSSKCSSFI